MKYLKYITAFLFAVVLFFISNSSVLAQFCGTDPESGNWVYCEPNPDPYGEPLNCVSTGEGGSQEAHDCCVSAGTSTCEAPTGGGGGGAAQCTAPQNVNCSSPSAVNYGSYTISAVTPAVCQLGNAQTYEGNCNYSIPNPEDPDNPICRTDEVITYGCCPVGSIEICPNLLVGSYQTTNIGGPSCSAGDVYVSHYFAYSVVVPVWICETDDEGNEWCHHSKRTDNYYTTTCNNYDIVCSCLSTCDVNAWSGWSSCSATCGGGVQTRTNACGTLQSQACNTQSCSDPWWQVKDGDITTNGDIFSDVAFWVVVKT